MKMKSAALIFTVLTTFAATSGAVLQDREIAFSEAEIQNELVKSGPQKRNYGGLITVTLLEPPTITLGVPAGRIGIAARVDIAVLGEPPVPVNVTGTSGIRYDDNAKAFFLDNPLAHRVESPALPREAEPSARQAINKLMANYFRSQPVYVLREDGTAQEIAARWLLRSVRIEPGKVVATLSPF